MASGYAALNGDPVDGRAPSPLFGTPRGSLLQVGPPDADILGVSALEVSLGLVHADTREQLRARETWTAVASELVGTACVTAAVCMTISNVVTPEDPSWQASTTAVTLVGFVAAAATYAVAAGIEATAPAMLNPAVVVGVFIAGRLNWLRALLFSAAQVAGAIGGAWLAYALAPVAARGGVSFCLAVRDGLTPGQTFAYEAFFAFVAVAALDGLFVDRRHVGARWAQTYASAVLVAALAGGAATGGAFNPARSLAVSIVSGCFADGWIYWVAPFAGAILSGALQRLHAWLLRTSPTESASRWSRSRSDTMDTDDGRAGGR